MVSDETICRTNITLVKTQNVVLSNSSPNEESHFSHNEPPSDMKYNSLKMADLYHSASNHEADVLQIHVIRDKHVLETYLLHLL
uniref:Uncharacterized protein n=1 Tax=Glossina morsitans morsitans TaxID=37546 RepID=A0A1B0FKU8_GLOMM